ncbi:MAG TPA: hypothetical protein VMX96_04945 [Dehalococcoidia bacterium]|nr:hypothetical protein [Dehalococcoidia bacterium]
MHDLDSYIMMGMGGFFLILGIISFLWARGEERGLNHSLSQRPDLREFLTRWPSHVEPGALRVGGWILVTVGLVLIILGGSFLATD